MPKPAFLSLTDDDIANLGLSTKQIADCIEATLLQSANGSFHSTPKSVLQPGDGRYIMSTLSASDDPALVVLKSLVLNPRNASHGLPTLNSTIVVNDSQTGLLKSVMDGNWITGARTAGLSVVAARRLANPASQSVTFIGCGVQARSHLDAFCDIFPLTEIRAFGRGEKNIRLLSEQARIKGLLVKACNTAQQAVTGADIIVTSITATSTDAPFLDANWLKPGTFASITDSGKPWIKDSLPAFGTILIDDHDQEAASPIANVAPGLVTADLMEMVSEKVAVGYGPDKSSAFIFRGIAAGDFAMAALVYETAQAAK